MATDYGSDVLALDDLTDPEQIVSGDLAAAYELARRLVTPDGAYAEIGDTAPYDSLDLREYMGARINLYNRAEIDRLQAKCRQVLERDPYVQRVAVVATFAAGTLSVSVQGEGAEGPFAFVVGVNSVSVSFFKGGA